MFLCHLFIICVCFDKGQQLFWSLLKVEIDPLEFDCPFKPKKLHSHALSFVVHITIALLMIV